MSFPDLRFPKLWHRSSGAIDTDEAPLLWDSWDVDGSIVPSKDMKLPWRKKSFDQAAVASQSHSEGGLWSFDVTA